MLETIWNFLIGFQFSSPVALWLYWIPLAICLVGYIWDFVKDYQRDLGEYQKSYYDAHLTLGSILGRLLVSFIPLINIGIVMFYHGWMLVKRIFDSLSLLLNQPIVRHNPKPNTDAK